MGSLSNNSPPVVSDSTTLDSKPNDPLTSQAVVNSLRNPAPNESGSASKVSSEEAKRERDENVLELKMEDAFGGEEKGQELGVAGVGAHVTR